MTPLYFEPAVGFNSTVAFTLFTLAAMVLYFSSNSSRVASFTTTICATGRLRVVLTEPPQPQEIAATVAATMHANPRPIRLFRLFHHNLSNLATMSKHVKPLAKPVERSEEHTSELQS